MPLSEDNKEKLTLLIESIRPIAEEVGPAKLVDYLLRSGEPEVAAEFSDGPEHTAAVLAANQNIAESRQEAEQYLAGLLGMM
jgi:hypothetical protein